MENERNPAPSVVVNGVKYTPEGDNRGDSDITHIVAEVVELLAEARSAADLNELNIDANNDFNGMRGAPEDPALFAYAYSRGRLDTVKGILLLIKAQLDHPA